MEQKKNFIINITFYLLIGILLWAICRYILPAFMPFLLAFMVALTVLISLKRGKEK